MNIQQNSYNILKQMADQMITLISKEGGEFYR